MGDLPKITNLTPLMNEISQIMLEAVMKNFDAEGRPSKWARLKSSTLKQRQKKGYTGKILQRTGALKRSIQASYNESSATVSTNLVYAATHQYGATISKSTLKTYLTQKKAGKDVAKPKSNRMSQWKIPARPFMNLTPKDGEKIKKSIVAYLTKAG